MNILTLVEKLDVEFGIAHHDENLVEWAVTNENKIYIYPPFLKRQTGLFVKNSNMVEKIYTVVFITEEIIQKVSTQKNSLIITHHHFNYYEDSRGVQAIDADALGKLKESNSSIYVAHAPLDTHSIYGTSVSLAKLCEIRVEELFYDYFGEPTAVIGSIEKTSFEDFSNHLMKKIKRPYLTLFKYHNNVEKVAVIAGGGDIPDILQYAYDAGCDTLFTGTIEHRWNVPFIQEGNKQFHELNKKLKLNLIGGTHYATERPAMIYLLEMLKNFALPCEYLEDESLLLAN